MHPPLIHIIRDQTCWLSAERSIYWEDKRTLIVADLHLGKTGHFRKSGIAIPQGVYKADLQRLMTEIYFFKAERLIIVGDMTHSAQNRELDLFLKWRNDIPGLVVKLIKGNHDILQDDWYRAANLELHEKEWEDGPFRFLHEDPDPSKEDSGLFRISGHVHPAIQLYGPGRQSLRFPCYYMTRQACVMPAFSHFSGTYSVKPNELDRVFAVTPTGVVPIG